MLNYVGSFRLNMNFKIPKILNVSIPITLRDPFNATNSLDPIVDRVLSKRKCMIKQQIKYVFLRDTGKKEVVQGHIVKWDREYTKTGIYKKIDYLGRPAPWQTRFERKTIRLNLRPELYGKLNQPDGWVFVNEPAVLRKCKV